MREARRALPGVLLALAFAMPVRGDPKPPSRCVSVVGYNDMEPMLTAVVARLTARRPELCYTLNLRSTRSGPTALIAGQADLAPMGAEMTPADRTAFRARWGADPIEIRVAHDSLAPAALSSPTGVLAGPGTPLRAMRWADVRRTFTRIAAPRWGDLGAHGAWADKPVHLYALAPKTAIGDYLLRGPLAAAGFSAGVRVFGHSREVAAAVGADPLALGLANVNHAGGRVQALALIDEHGTIAHPDAATVHGGRWPLDRFLLVYARRGADGRILPGARALVEALLSPEGQAIIARPPRSYLPLNKAERSAERRKLRC